MKSSVSSLVRALIPWLVLAAIFSMQFHIAEIIQLTEYLK